MLIRSVLIAAGLVACANPGADHGSDLHALPPAPADCALSLGPDAILVDDAMTVCVPGAYCPPGYAAGEVYRDYQGSFRYPAGWTLRQDTTNMLTLTRSGFSAFVRIGGHQLRLDEADAIDRLDDSAAAWPDAIREQLEIDGRPAVHYAYAYDTPHRGVTEPDQTIAFNLDVAHGIVVAHFAGDAPASSSPEVFCEIESILASVRFAP